VGLRGWNKFRGSLCPIFSFFPHVARLFVQGYFHLSVCKGSFYLCFFTLFPLIFCCLGIGFGQKAGSYSCFFFSHGFPPLKRSFFLCFAQKSLPHGALFPLFSTFFSFFDPLNSQVCWGFFWGRFVFFFFGYPNLPLGTCAVLAWFEIEFLWKPILSEGKLL